MGRMGKKLSFCERAGEREGERKIEREKETEGERERKRENLNLNLNLFLFYNGYKLGRMPLFIWPLIQNYNLSTTET